MRLTDSQWEAIEPILNPSTSLRVNRSKGGRPRSDNRQIVNGIVWILLSGTQWSDLPSSYGSYVTCWRRYTEWSKNGVWEKIWEVLFSTMDQKQRLEWSLALWQGSFVPMKKNQ